jgi:hypothetical protein
MSTKTKSKINKSYRLFEVPQKGSSSKSKSVNQSEKVINSEAVNSSGIVSNKESF